jgi:putative exporter of polyketide antibiotics
MTGTTFAHFVLIALSFVLFGIQIPLFMPVSWSRLATGVISIYLVGLVREIDLPTPIMHRRARLNGERIRLASLAEA